MITISKLPTYGNCTAYKIRVGNVIELNLSNRRIFRYRFDLPDRHNPSVDMAFGFGTLYIGNLRY